jgi:hypothetical protein
MLEMRPIKVKGERVKVEEWRFLASLGMTEYRK